MANSQVLDGMDDKALEEVDEAVKYAQASPEPAKEDLYSNVYAE